MKRGKMLALGAAALAMAPPAAASETVIYSYDALGRLVTVRHSGAVNNGRANSLCYDPAGNRALYRSSGAGGLADCATAPAPPTNQPPVAAPDSLTATTCSERTFNVAANDSDPEGDIPLAVTEADQPWASVNPDGMTVRMTTPPTSGFYTIAYTVADSLGATAQGTLSVTVTGGQECF